MTGVRLARGSAERSYFEKQKGEDGAEPHRLKGGLDQEGSVERVKRGRVLRGRDGWPEDCRRPAHLGDRQSLDRDCYGSTEGNMGDRQNARRLRDHFLAAVVAMVGRAARHGPAALHRLLVSGHRHTVRELHQQKEARCRHQRCDLAKHPVTLM
jgi:hypothetical protein